jgi:DNA-binding NtrC family response regulator
MWLRYDKLPGRLQACRLTNARLCWGSLLLRRGDLNDAIQLLEKELRHAQDDKDHFLAINLPYQLVKARIETGDLRQALDLTRSARRKSLELRRVRSIQEGNLSLGVVWLHAGDHALAIKYLEEAQRPAGERHPHIDSEILLHLGIARTRAGCLAEGKGILEKAAAFFRKLRIPLRVCECLLQLAAAASIEGRDDEGRRLCDRAWRIVSSIPRDARPIILWARAFLARARNHLPTLRAGDPLLLDLFHDLNGAREILREKKARRLEWQVCHQLALVHRALGHEEGGAALLVEARQGLMRVCKALSPRVASRFRKTPEARALEETDGRRPGSGARGTRDKIEEDPSLIGRLQRLEESYRALCEENRRLREENETLGTSIATRQVEVSGRGPRGPKTAAVASFHGLVGASPAMQRLFGLIEKAGAANLPVLVRGETGSGKDLVMRAIHEVSPRRDGPFISESLAAIPDSLIESELFGHAEGAFTGAAAARPGRLAAAHGGTLCLSEIDEVSPALQAKLLNALESRQVRSVGGSETREYDFRLITSARTDLRLAASGGRMREDFLYRVLGIEIILPPLRERREDIPLLVNHFLQVEAGRFGPRPRIDPEALEMLFRHDWPGNVRELENEIRRLVILDPARIRARDLAASWSREEKKGPLSGIQEGVSWAEAKEALDRAYYEDALRRSGGQIAAAARHLGLHERSIYKMRRRFERPRDKNG